MNITSDSWDVQIRALVPIGMSADDLPPYFATDAITGNKGVMSADEMIDSTNSLTEYYKRGKCDIALGYIQLRQHPGLDFPVLQVRWGFYRQHD